MYLDSSIALVFLDYLPNLSASIRFGLFGQKAQLGQKFLHCARCLKILNFQQTLRFV